MPVMSNTIISSNLIATLIITRKFPQLFFATAAVCDKIFKSHRLSELLAFCIHLGEKSETDWINWMNDALSSLSLLLVFSFINEWERKSTARRAWAEIVMRMRRRAFFLRDYRLLWKSLKKICFYFLLCKKNQQKVNIEN